MTSNSHKTAGLASSAVDGYSLAMFSGFSDEMQKISGKASEVIKNFGHYLAGGAKSDVAQEVVHEIKPGRAASFFGAKPKQIAQTVITPGVGPRVGMGIGALTNPSTRGEAIKVLGARGAAAGGVGAAAVGVSKHNKEEKNQDLSAAYMAGAKDMYAQGQGQ